MKTLAIWFGKKYALSVVQDIIAAKKENVAEWAKRINIWIERIGKVVKFLGTLAEALEDGNLTKEEAEGAIADAKKLAEEVTKDTTEE